MNKGRQQELADALRLAAEQRFHYLPIGDFEAKTPPRGFKWAEQCSADEAAIKDWHSQYPALAIACQASNIIVVDVDKQHITDEMKPACKALVAKLVRLAGGSYAVSQRGGFHIFFKAFDKLIVKTAKLYKKPGAFKSEKPWIDLKAHRGAYVVAYHRHKAHEPLRPLPWIVARAVLPEGVIDSELKGRLMLDDALDDIACAVEGERNDNLNLTAYKLFDAGYRSPEYVGALTEAAMRSGLTPGEVRGTINSALTAALERADEADGAARRQAIDAASVAELAAPETGAGTEPAAAEPEAGQGERVRQQEAAKMAAEITAPAGEPSKVEQAIMLHQEFKDDGTPRPLIFSKVAAHLWPDLRFYVNEAAKGDDEGEWLEWTGSWASLSDADIRDRIDELIEAGGPFTDEVHNRKLSSCKKRLGRIKRAGAISDIDSTDSSMLLDASGRAISLETGEPCAQREDMPIKVRLGVDFNENAKCPRWIDCLNEWHDGDGEIIGYLQRLAGYALLPHNDAHLLAFFHGRGRNGKGTFLTLLMWIMGRELAKPIDCAPFMKGPGGGDPLNALAPLEGVRLAVLSEPDDGDQWRPGRLKTLSGDGEFQARWQYERAKTMISSALIIAQGNALPKHRDNSTGWQRRWRVVNWAREISERVEDRGLKGRLMNDEGEGILQWQLEGLRDYNALKGDAPPEKVKVTTKNYMLDYGSQVLAFAKTQLVKAPGVNTRVSDAFSAYKRWRVDEGHDESVDDLPSWEKLSRFRISLKTMMAVEKTDGRQYHIVDHALRPAERSD